MTAAKETTALVRRLFEEVWNENNDDAANEIIDEHYSSIENLAFSSTPGPEIVAAEIEFYHSIYDGLQFTVQRTIGQGDTVVTIWQATGTSKDETFVNRAGKTKHKALQAEGVSLTQVKEGRITSHAFFWPRYPLFP
jgi:SnoaL-like polyketide cyclase